MRWLSAAFMASLTVFVVASVYSIGLWLTPDNKPIAVESSMSSRNGTAELALSEISEVARIETGLDRVAAVPGAPNDLEDHAVATRPSHKTPDSRHRQRKEQRDQLLAMIRDDFHSERAEIRSLKQLVNETITAADLSPARLPDKPIDRVVAKPAEHPAKSTSKPETRSHATLGANETSEIQMVNHLANVGNIDAAVKLMSVMKDHRVARILSGLPDQDLAEQMLIDLRLQKTSQNRDAALSAGNPPSSASLLGR